MTRREAEEIYVEAFERNDRDAIRWLGANDRYFLLTCLCRREDARHDWVYARCRDVEADPDNHVDVWARAHFKSSIITFAGIVQEILRNREITICIFSHDKPTAKNFLRQIKLEFEENTLLRWAYPEIFWENPKKEAPTWGEDSGLVLKRRGNPKEATLECSGLVDGMSTGSHYDLLVYDDIIVETMVTSKEMIQKVTTQWELSLNLGKPDCRAWMIGTRYDFADSYGIIMMRGVFKERRFAATDDGTFDGKPVLLTQKQWDEKKANSSKPTIASQQLLNPLFGTEMKFDVRWLKFWLVRPKRLNVYIMGDPSKGKKVSSDNTAFSVIGVDVGRNKYLLDGFRHRMPLSRRWRVLRNLYARWSKMPGIEMVSVGYEQYGLQTDLEYFQEQMLLDEVSFPIEELSWTSEGRLSKEQRIERLEPDIRMGRFLLPQVIDIDEEGNITHIDPRAKKAAKDAIARNESWRVAKNLRQKDEDNRLYDVIEGFLEEFKFFPFGTKNDFLDATSRIYDMGISPPMTDDDQGGPVPILEPEDFMDS